MRQMGSLVTMDEKRRRVALGLGGSLLALSAAVMGVWVPLGLSGQEEDDEAVTTEVAVHVGEVSRADLRRTVTAYGRVETAPANHDVPPAAAAVASAVPGLLVEIDGVEGERVAAGDTLFRLDSRSATVARDRAQQELTLATETLARQRQLLEAGGASERQVFEAEARRDSARLALDAAETELSLLEITAPIAGTVLRIDARLGQGVDATEPLAQIVDLDRLVVRAAVPSSEASALRLGQEARLSGSREKSGELLFIGDAVDARTDTVPIRVSLEESAGLRLGTLVELLIVVEEHEDCLAVPVDSVVRDENGESWIAVLEESAEGVRAVRRAVERGLREGGLVEVSAAGLHEGQRVVTEEAYGLPAETRVRILSP